MKAVVEKALDLWGWRGGDVGLVAARENAVYRVDYRGHSAALRLHRRGYRSDAELWSELHWMAAVARGGIGVPAPIPTVSGGMLQIIDGVQVDALTWLSGAPVSAIAPRLSGAERKALFKRIGRQMAALHEISDAWSPPDGFTRCAWDRPGLVGDTPLWGRFWDNPLLSTEDHELLCFARDIANAKLLRIEHDLDYGLIHADLVGENVMVDEGRIQMIDFDDGGYGFRLFDIATALVKHLGRPDFQSLKSAMFEGYLSVRTIDLSALDLFLLIRAATYVGWNIERMDEDGARARNDRFVATARDLARAHLA